MKFQEEAADATASAKASGCPIEPQVGNEAFDLSEPDAWDEIGAAWRAAFARTIAACDAHTACEAKAQALYAGSPDKAEPREAMLARLERNKRIDAECGVPEAQERMEAASDLEHDLVRMALGAPAPTLAAFLLKLDILAADPSDTDAFSGDRDAWAVFLADARRFASGKGL